MINNVFIAISTSTVVLTIIAILLKIGDVFSTVLAVTIYGIDVEANPVVKFLMNRLGVFDGLFFTLVLFAIVLMWGIKVMPQRFKWLPPGIACAMYIPVVVNNVYQLVK